MHVSGLIDIHSHILPGVDDGAKNIQQSRAIARQYIEQGIETVIATPHWIHGSKWSAAPDEILALISEVEEDLQRFAIPLHLLPGMEIAYSRMFWDFFDSTSFLSLAGTGFFLIEFPLQDAELIDFDQFIQRMKENSSVRFILAHPERCPVFQKNIDCVRLLVEHGLLVQVNIGSLLGHFGSVAKKTAFLLLRQQLSHFLATDTHGHHGRRIPKGNEWSTLADMLGKAVVLDGCAINPYRLIKNEKVVPLVGAEENWTSIDDKPLKKMGPAEHSTFIQKLAGFFKPIDR